MNVNELPLDACRLVWVMLHSDVFLKRGLQCVFRCASRMRSRRRYKRVQPANSSDTDSATYSIRSCVRRKTYGTFVCHGSEDVNELVGPRYAQATRPVAVCQHGRGKHGMYPSNFI